MSEKKKQHYVPRFVLRNFSTDGKSVNMFALQTQKHVTHAPIANQCQKNFFYGKNLVIENELCSLEIAWAKILKKIIVEHKIPSPNENDFSGLLLYIAVQKFRTDAIKKEADEMFTAIFREVAKQLVSKDLEKMLPCISLQNNKATSFALCYACIRFRLLLDMKIKILLSQDIFIINDNPVIFHNYLPKDGGDENSTMLHSGGLIIYTPISPCCQIVLYDPHVYSIDNENGDSLQIDEKDVWLLNKFQYESAKESLYYLSVHMIPEIEKLKTICSPHSSSGEIVSEVFDSMHSNGKSKIIAISKKVEPAPMPGFLKINNDFSRAEIRNKGGFDMINKFETHVRTGEYKSSEFEKFVSEFYPKLSHLFLKE